MEKVNKHLKKAKTWNMVLLILGIISVISGIVGLKGVLSPDTKTFEQLGAYGQELLAYQTSPLTKAISIIGLLVSIVLVVWYFKANKMLNDEQVPPKYPYYIYLGYTVLSLCLTMIMQPRATGMAASFALVTTIATFVIQAIVALPAVLVIVHLFKAEPEGVTHE